MRNHEHVITKEDIEKTIKVLIDNGVDPKEAKKVLRKIGFTLLEKELFPEEHINKVKILTFDNLLRLLGTDYEDLEYIGFVDGKLYVNRDNVILTIPEKDLECRLMQSLHAKKILRMQIDDACDPVVVRIRFRV